MNKKVLICRNNQRVNAFRTDHPEIEWNPREWIIMASNDPNSTHRVRGRIVNDDNVYWYDDWWAGKYAELIVWSIRPCIRQGDTT